MMDSDSGAARVTGGLGEEILTVIRENTIAVMTDSEDQRGEWQSMLQRLISIARGVDQPQDIAFLEAVYHLTEGRAVDLAQDNPYQPVMRAIVNAIQSSQAAAERDETPPDTAGPDIPAELMKTIRINTVAVMTVAPDRREEWRAAIAKIQGQAFDNNLTEDSDFFQALLDLLDGNPISLGEDNPYAELLQSILDGIETYNAQGAEDDVPPPPGSGITGNLMNTIRHNTVTVMIVTPDEREQWRAKMANVLTQAEIGQLQIDIEFFQAILDILDEETPAIPPDNPHYGTIQAIQAEVSGADDPEAAARDEAMIAAVRKLLTSENWNDARRILEENQEILLLPEIDQLFDDNIRYAREQEQPQTVEILQVFQKIVQNSREVGIAAVFERLEELSQISDEVEAAETASGDGSGQLEPGPTAPGLPEGIVREVVAALRGNATRKQHLFDTITRIHPEEPGAEALIREVQKALFGDPVEQLGGGLAAPYDAVWQAIVRGVKGTG